MPVTMENYNDVLDYHMLNPDQRISVERVRTAARLLVSTLLTEVPNCADQQAAIRHVREAVFTGNAGISLNGTV